ncbi:MAG: PaaI family thioesterase [Alphaproteobacteria bacterium]
MATNQDLSQNDNTDLKSEIESRFAQGMGAVKDLGIQIECTNGRLSHMHLPYRADLCVEDGQGLCPNLASTLLDTAFGLDVMLFANVKKYTATIDYSTSLIAKPAHKVGLVATTEVKGTNHNSVIMTGEVRELETGSLVLTGQGNFLFNKPSTSSVVS